MTAKKIKVGIWHTTPAATLRVRQQIDQKSNLQVIWAVPTEITPSLIEETPIDLLVVHHGNDLEKFMSAIPVEFRPRIAVTTSSKLPAREVNSLKQFSVHSILKLPRTKQKEAAFLKAISATAENRGHKELDFFNALIAPANLRSAIIDGKAFGREEVGAIAPSPQTTVSLGFIPGGEHYALAY